jgi:hypothetical protein
VTAQAGAQPLWENAHAFVRDAVSGKLIEQITTTRPDALERRFAADMAEPIVAMKAAITAAVANGALTRERAKAIDTILSDTKSPALAKIQAVADLLKDAGVFVGFIGIVIDARSNAYDAEIIRAAIKEAGSSTAVKYIVLVDDKTIDKFTGSGISTLTVAEGQDAMAVISGEARAQNILGGNISVALTEENVGTVTRHYDETKDKPVDTKANFLVSNKAAVGMEEGKNVPAATLFTAVLRRLVSYAAKEKERATVVTLGCKTATLNSLKVLEAQGILKLFELAKLEFNRIFREFVTAMQATAQSL